MRHARIFLALSLLAVAALGTVRADDEKSPFEKAKAGQWTLTKVVNIVAPGNEVTNYVYMWCEKVDGRKVTVKIQILEDEKTPMGGMTPSSMEIDLDQKPDPQAPKPTNTGAEELKVKDKALKCVKWKSVIKDARKGTLVTVDWKCDALPLFGVVKSVTKDEYGRTVKTADCVDYGDEGGAEKKKKDEKDEKK
jgi:hypothetical protein